MDDDDPDGRWSSLSALPQAERGDVAGGPTFTIEVDGEAFAVHAGQLGGTHYAWLSGPNAGYGFTTSGAADVPPEEHHAAIRNFLAQVDPVTGFIEDD